MTADQVDSGHTECPCVMNTSPLLPGIHGQNPSFEPDLGAACTGIH